MAVTSEGTVRVAYRVQREGENSYAGLPLNVVTLGSAAPPRAVGAERAVVFRLAADGRGGATLLWSTRRTWIDHRPVGPVRTLEIRADGFFTASGIRTLTRRGEGATDISLACGANGDALAVWTTARGARLRAVRRGVHPAADR